MKLACWIAAGLVPGLAWWLLPSVNATLLMLGSVALLVVWAAAFVEYRMEARRFAGTGRPRWLAIALWACMLLPPNLFLVLLAAQGRTSLSFHVDLADEP